MREFTEKAVQEAEYEVERTLTNIPKGTDCQTEKQSADY
jgi:hypothetical protein